MKKIIYLFIGFSIINCLGQETSSSNNFDYGKTENGLYSNSFFDLKISINPDWVVQEKEQVKNLIKQGEEFITSNNEDLKTLIKASEINTAYLLTVFKYEVGTSTTYNPSFMAIAENLKNAPGVKNGKDYLFHVKNLLKSANMGYSYGEQMNSKTIGKNQFYVLEANITHLGITVQQEYLATIANGFCLSFIISYSNEEEKNELYEIINTIK